VDVVHFIDDVIADLIAVECAADTSVGFTSSVSSGRFRCLRVKNQRTEKPVMCCN